MPRASVTDHLSRPDLHVDVDVISFTVIGRYLSLASVLLVLWDWLTTLDDEVSYIWGSPVKLSGKPLYIFIRYGGIAFQFFDCVQSFGVWNAKFCTIYYHILPFGTTIFLYAVDVLLAYRTLCLYRMNRKLVVVNIAFFFLSVAACLVFVGCAYGKLTAIPTPSELSGCWSFFGSPVLVVAIFTPGLVFELWLFLLVSCRATRHSKSVGRNRLGIVQLLFAHSIGWFSVIALLIVTNGLGFALLPTGLKTAGFPLLRAAIIICGCRLTLHMRKVAANEQEVRPTTIETDGVDVLHTQNFLSQLGDDELASYPTSPGLPISKAWVFARQFGLPPPLKDDFDPTTPCSIGAPGSDAPHLGTPARPNPAYLTEPELELGIAFSKRFSDYYPARF